MKRRKFIKDLGVISGGLMATRLLANDANLTNKLSFDQGESTLAISGIWRFTFGVPEKITPQSTRSTNPSKIGMAALPIISTCPIEPLGVITKRGTLVKLPLKANEYIYGLGLQFQSFQQRGSKKMLRVNADPKVDTGDSHAPVPFFVTTSGYGVLIDTARYATFYLGNEKRKLKENILNTKEGNNGWNPINGTYERLRLSENELMIEIPRTEGVTIYIFAGPTMLQAVQRYNLFGGGGALPPRWGLGFWYRCQSDFSQDEVKSMANYFRQSKIPCDVIGLEPGWQSHTYSCSYVWSKRFPNPAEMLKDMKKDAFHVNLWEHAFVHPTSPLYNDLFPYSGDYEVWDGLVPDFITKEGSRIYANFHKKEHVDLGVSGYKADECDNSDFTGNWSFPELSKFPSGADGELMHSLFGLRYQETLLSVFNEKQLRTYGLVRSSGALASSYPFVLYSDLYDHNVFIHAIAQSGFSGLLWTPEVREAVSNEDLIRRLQSVVFSPLAMVNAWYLKNVPWKQIEQKANNEGLFAANWEQLEAQCRKIIELRMKLIPYIHTAFVNYYKKGIPPFRALIMDYPNDSNVLNLSNQFLVGENMLVAPVVAGESQRKVYLPEGDWYDFWSHAKYAGKREYSVDVPLDKIPVYIKAGTILPLAKPTLHTEDPDSWKLKIEVYGDNAQPTLLYEEDGSFDPTLIEIKLEWNKNKQKVNLQRNDKPLSMHYSIVDWQMIN
jgi:alpha-D-xyloside xylohydrolase